jgi:hypothetical protein
MKTAKKQYFFTQPGNHKRAPEMAKEKNIKSVNRKYLVGYMILNWLALLVISGRLSADLERIMNLYQNVSSLLGLSLVPLSVIIEGLMSSDFKHKLVFWRISNPLPASRAFTEIAPRDSRIDMNKLELLMANSLPLDPEKQNATWYGLYKKCSSKEQVFDAHKSFLLTRDLAALSFVLIPLSLAAYLLWGIPLEDMAIHLMVLAAVLLLATVASQNYGKRFVGNVLVETLHSER